MATSSTSNSRTAAPADERAPAWRVAPAAAGGGVRPRGRLRLWPLLLVSVALFAFNYWLASRAVQPAPRVHVPYSPFFVAQVRAGNVRAITSTGPAIQGAFKHAVRYPTRASGDRSSRFVTEIPAFADTNSLSRLLQSKG